MSANDSCNRRLEATTISEILHLFGQGNLTFIKEKSGQSQGVLKPDVCATSKMGELWEVELTSAMLAFHQMTALPSRSNRSHQKVVKKMLGRTNQKLLTYGSVRARSTARNWYVKSDLGLPNLSFMFLMFYKSLSLLLR